MAAVLVGTGLWVHAGIGKAAAAVSRGQAITIAFAARRALRSAAQLNLPTLQEVLDELAPQGLRYLEVSGPDPGQKLAAGNREESRWLRAEQLTPLVSIELDKTSSRAHLHMSPQEAPSPGDRHLVAEPAGPPPDHPLRGRQVVLEIESASAGGLASRAGVTLTVSLLAAAALLGLCAVFWRISLRAEKVALQLEHDRQLKLLGQMSAVLGHEIRNPLASLKGHIQLLLEKLPGEHPGRRGAEVVLRETVRLEELSASGARVRAHRDGALRRYRSGSRGAPSGRERGRRVRSSRRGGGATNLAARWPPHRRGHRESLAQCA